MDDDIWRVNRTDSSVFRLKSLLSIPRTALSVPMVVAIVGVNPSVAFFGAVESRATITAVF